VKRKACSVPTVLEVIAAGLYHESLLLPKLTCLRGGKILTGREREKGKKKDIPRHKGRVTSSSLSEKEKKATTG